MASIEAEEFHMIPKLVVRRVSSIFVPVSDGRVAAKTGSVDRVLILALRSALQLVMPSVREASATAMTSYSDGSIVWSRSSSAVKKFWPSIIFRSWDAAKDAGLVHDGIAFLIEHGRKIDVMDAEAAPPEGFLLNLYLGNSSEWEFVPAEESCVLPFLQHREKLCKQRFGAQMKYHFKPALEAADARCNLAQGRAMSGNAATVKPSFASPDDVRHKRPEVLLDFGTGTSFSSFAELWEYLLHNGWATAPGKGLATWHYIPPDSNPKKRNPVLGVDYFTSEEMVLRHVQKRKKDIGRRESCPPKRRRETDRELSTEASPSAPSEGSSPSPSVAPDHTPPASGKSFLSSAAVSTRTAATGIAIGGASPPARSNISTLPLGNGPNRSSPFGSSAESKGRPGAGGHSRAGIGDKYADHDSAVDGGAGGGEADLGIGTDEGRCASGGGTSGSGGSPALGAPRQGQPEVRGDASPKQGTGAASGGVNENESGGGGGGGGDQKRSHGRTMQVEAANIKSDVSTGRGSANLTGEVLRQEVTARKLSSSPPAPSPAKKPKRTGPHLAPRELARLAKKQVERIRGLLAGTAQPYPGPCGLDAAVGEIGDFIEAARSAFVGRNAGSRGSTSGAKNALVVAGRSGTGKSTAWRAATKAASAACRRGDRTGIRFATVKCQEGSGQANEIFSELLAAVTGSKSKVAADRAQTALERLTEPSSVLSVVASLDGGQDIVYELGTRGFECDLVPLFGFKEHQLRVILGQTLGASSPDDTDGEAIAGLVNKGALDIIAKTVARVCGSARIALLTCHLAFSQRSRELEASIAGTRRTGQSSAGAAGGSAQAFASSPKSGYGAADVLLTVNSAKDALNSFLAGGSTADEAPRASSSCA